MNNISILALVAAMALVCSSCSKGGEPGAGPTKSGPNKFPTSKAVSEFSDSDFANGDRVGLYIVARASAQVAGVLAGSGNLFDNKEFTYNAGVMTATTEESYPQSAPSVDIYGYAPYSAAGIDDQKQLSFSVATDQSASLAPSDLLWVSKAAIPTNSTTPTKLIFSHRLSKVVVMLTAGDGVTLTACSVTINNTLPTTNMNMSDGTLAPASGTATSIKARNIPSTTEFHAIIPPQSVATLTNFITITTTDRSYNYDLAAAKQLASGKAYVFDLEVNINDLTVKVDGAVDDWAVGDTTTGEAI